MLTDFTGDELHHADDAGDPIPSGVSCWTWYNFQFKDQLRWHHAIRKASKGGVVFTKAEQLQAEAFYANRALVLTF